MMTPFLPCSLSALLPISLSPLLVYREFFTPIVNGYIWRAGLAIVLFGTAWILRHNRNVAEGYGTGLVMLGMLRAEDVPKLRSAHRMGWLIYFLSTAAWGWFGYYCNDINSAKPAVEENPLKNFPTAPKNPLSEMGKNPLAPGKSPANMSPGKPGAPGSPYAPMPGR